VITCPQRSQLCGTGYFACGIRSMRGCTDRQVPRSRNTTVQTCMGSIGSHRILQWWILLFSSAKASSPLVSWPYFCCSGSLCWSCAPRAFRSARNVDSGVSGGHTLTRAQPTVLHGPAFSTHISVRSVCGASIVLARRAHSGNMSMADASRSYWGTLEWRRTTRTQKSVESLWKSALLR